ncbi:unnamed protein product [Diamesa serratosioi]
MSKIKKSKSKSVAILENQEVLEEKVALVIVNCSSDSLKALADILRDQIATRQRRYIACLSEDDFSGLTEQTEIQDFLKRYISNEIKTNYELDLKIQQKKNLNLLEVWKKDLEKDEQKRKSISNKVQPKTNLIKRNEISTGIKYILDCPEEFELIKLFLVLINIYNYDVVKASVSMDSSFKTLINMYPQFVEETENISEQSNNFWNQIIANKFTKDFENLAFIDLDGPANVPLYLLELRKSLIYSQMSYLFYDIEDIKSHYQMFLKNLELIELELENPDKDLEELNQRLDNFPQQFISVELIFEMIMDQICEPLNDLDGIPEIDPFILNSFKKEFYDMNDSLFKRLGPNNKMIYTLEIEKMKNKLQFWNNVTSIEDDERRILNYFLIKIQEMIEIQFSCDFLEFYIYILQFSILDNKASKSLVTDKPFHEIRSVSTAHEHHLEVLRSVSDFYVDYQNSTKIPFAIAQLVEDENILQYIISLSDIQVQLKSPSAMIQYLTFLLDTYDNYHHEYFKLLDVILIKFKKSAKPYKFTSRSYLKIIPTPVCFRDFNDYVKYEIADWIKIKDDNKTANGTEKGSSTTNSLQYNESAGDFNLASSLKYRSSKLKSNKDSFDEPAMNYKESSTIDAPASNYDFIGYNISNKRNQLNGIESIFQSFGMNVKATIEKWLNAQKYLNFVGNISAAQLTFTYDFMLQKYNGIMLIDDGLRFCIEQNKNSEDEAFVLNFNVFVILPNNLKTSNITLTSIEQSWFDHSPINEQKRVTFANGFVLIYFENGLKKGLCANGTIYEFAEKPRSKRNSSVSQTASENETELTKIHKDSINFVQFLKDIFSIWKFKMILPNGLGFLIKNQNIIDQLAPIEVTEFNSDCGNVHLIREDGVKILYSMNYSKCLFEDGTVITSRLNDQSVATIDFEMNAEAPLNKSILEEIWWTQAAEDVQLVFDGLLDNVSEDYFVNIKKSVRIEHQHYGCVYFGDNTVNMSFYNGSSLEANQDRVRLRLKDGVQMLLKDTKATLNGKTCEQCLRFQEICLNYKVNEELLVSVRDLDDNSFEILQSGKQRLYENNSYIEKVCPVCAKNKEKIANEFGDRLIVLNRDYSGYEISSNCTPENDDKTIQTPSANLVYEENKYFCSQFKIEVYDKDVNVEKVQIPDDEFDNESVVSSVASEKIRKTKSQSSISDNNKRKAKKLIKIYENPLVKLPKCLSVKSTIKLNDKFDIIVDAFAHLKKYSTVKSILKMTGLNDGIAIKKTFEENFKSVVQKTIIEFIIDDLKKSQRFIAGGIVDLLLMNVVPDPKYSNEDIVDEEVSLEVEKKLPSSAIPVPIKSFSFS